MSGHNVVVSVHDRGYKRARELLEPYGRIHKTDYYNVLAMTVEDTGTFLDRLGKLTDVVPEVLEVISRAVPAQTSFAFQSAEEFEAQAREAALAWAPELAGKSFHVRLHRRGFKGRLSSHDEERFLDAALLQALEAAGTPGRIAFEDPDAVIDVETLGNWAGLSLWTRAELARYPFLKVD
jgi:tRNA(Ser,Leu) C12 N-acetylase TAN1